MRLLLLGCSGFVGRELVPFLLELGHELTVVSRQAQPFPALSGVRLACLQLDPAVAEQWNHEGLMQALDQADGVVNLAGEPIAEKRWTPEHRRQLLASRVATTENLMHAMAQLSQPPGVLVNASAVGYYGTSENDCLTETSPSGSDYLSQICREWEAAAAQVPSGCRAVVMRIGIVLGPDGGALGKMLPVFRLGLGGPVGSGRQWMSWIHRHDLCRLIASALEDASFQGTYNAVAPQPVTMGRFADALGRALGRPSFLPVPGPILQILLGDGAKVVLQGQKVLPQRLLDKGFHFQYPEVTAAIAAATSPGLR